MALPSLSFILGLLVLSYLSTFVIFAIFRLATGISIQRLGLSSLRRISFAPKDGIRLDIRGLGYQIHRPTFSQPTWFSLVLTELKITVDLAKLSVHAIPASTDYSKRNEPSPAPKSQEKAADDFQETGHPKFRHWQRVKTLNRLIEIKERVKRLHRILPWIKLVDVVAHKTSLNVQNVGAIHIGTCLVSVDTRKHMLDRSRLFLHKNAKSEQVSPAEWVISVRSVLLEPHGKESIEILDHCVTNIHGFIHPRLEGLRDASVFVKLGRLHIPYDDVVSTSRKAKLVSARHQSTLTSIPEQKIGNSTPWTQSDEPPHSLDEDVLQVVSDARDFIASVLRGIREVSFAVSVFGLTKCLDTVRPAGSPVYLSLSLKEMGLDLYKMDPTTPAHSMYFSRKDIAHQALLSAISLSLGIDDGQDHPEKLLYAPMTTATVKTTLPSKLLQFATHDEDSDRNANVFFSNLVVTSPSVDVDARHLPMVLAIIENYHRPSSTANVARRGHRFFSQLLPRADIKLSIQEPVVRVALPSVEPIDREGFDFDLLISTTSSLSFDIESSHIVERDSRYLLSSRLRLNTQKLYYQTASKKRHDLLNLDSIELKTDLSADPHVRVNISATLQTFSFFMVRPEINNGIRQIIRQIRPSSQMDKLRRPRKAETSNFLRRVPPWLQHIYVQAYDFNFEIAGIDKRLSRQPRGFVIHLESWTIEYKAQKDQRPQTPSKRRRGSVGTNEADDFQRSLSPTGTRLIKTADDGRRVALHFKGLESFVIETVDTWDHRPSLSIPRAEVAFTTSHDGRGPVIHLTSLVRSIFVEYSLFRHYCIGVATVMLRKTFFPPVNLPTKQPKGSPAQESPHLSSDGSPNPTGADRKAEFLVVDFKANFVQVKANLPSDPMMMLHMYDLELSRHRGLHPFGKAHIGRLYTESPTIRGAWNRVVSLKAPKLDMREHRRKQGVGFVHETSFDFVSDAIRIGLPSQLVVHKIFDNIVNCAKTTAQLHHRFKTDSDTYILGKHPECAKRVPRISMRTHVLLFELEDDAFEWKLGVIFRAGLVEQKQRIAREEAYRLKCRRLQGMGQGPSLQRPSKASSARSHSRDRGRSRDRRSGEDHKEDFDESSSGHHRSTSRADREVHGRSMRYDSEGFAGLSSDSKTSADHAWNQLERFNAQSWKTRVDQALHKQHGQISELRTLLWGLDNVPGEEYHNETILQIPSRPALLGVVISDVNVNIDKPSFPIDRCPDFLHRVGKGLPKDTQFSLLMPLNANLELGEFRATLRDYPLPLLHIPSIKPGQSPRLPSWSLYTDFVIAEEYRDSQSTRDLSVQVVPQDKLEEGRGAFAVDVRRTVSPVKTYSDMKIEIHTARDTRFTWSTSYQPAIQDMMQVIEGFTKPQVDPSDRIGFWDKIRLSFHSRINVSWKGDGDVHLMLKGARDPYTVTGYGAGFVMIWRNDVHMNIWQDDEPSRFITIDSGDYILAVPDFSQAARQSPDLVPSQAHGTSGFSTNREAAYFKKLVMKLSGRVRWQMGLVFERSLENGQRTFQFEPHHKVTLRNPMHVKSIQEQHGYDAFRGFRSNFIHMSIGISAPSDRDWTDPTLSPSTNYNAVHLSPRFFTHFFAWWSNFSGNMSLPIHQGPLFPGIEKSGKKFGRHLATIKYSLLLSPLFISHVYKHKEAEDFMQSEDTVFATGLKSRLDNFRLDLHQRREEFNSEVKGMNKIVKTSGMRIYQTLLDLVSADIRAVSANITGTSAEALNRASTANLAEFQEAASKPANLSSFTVPDNDYTWVDIDDLVEIDWTLPTDSNPQTKILPLASAPRFTYRRHTDHQGTISGDTSRSSPFGYEETHPCVMSSKDESRKVQIDLIQTRLDVIDQCIEEHSRRIGAQELAIIRGSNEKTDLESQLQHLKGHGSILEEKRSFLSTLLDELLVRMNGIGPASPDTPGPDILKPNLSNGFADTVDPDWDSRSGFGVEDLVDPSTLADHITDFNNRFVVHNAQIKWNNDLRNIMLRYMHQVSQRRGFVYYTSRRAVKFILDIVEEQKSKKQFSTRMESRHPSVVETPQLEREEEVANRIEQLLKDSKKFVDADDPDVGDATTGNLAAANKADRNIARGYIAQNTYHVRLVAPQLQLQSMKNPKSCVLVTSRGMRLKVFQIMDKERIADEISGLVQRRFSAEMDNIQFFVASKQSFGTDFLHMYSGSTYGASPVSRWPPWVPLEVMFDFDIGQFGSHGFSRVVQRTSASLRFDKYNKLRLTCNEEVSDDQQHCTKRNNEIENAMDHLWIEFPKLRALCDSSQYYAMYTIVLDLLLYSEPLEKTRNERLEKILLVSDFSDLRGAPEMITRLQERIRQLEEIKTHFHINEKYLDKKGWRDRISVDEDLASCEDELFFMMKAITTSQRNLEDRRETNQTTGLLRYYFNAPEIVWHLTKGLDQPLAEFQLGNASFERTDNSDGSNHTSMQIERIRGLNLLKHALYPEMVSAYTPKSGDGSDLKMFRVNWHMLEAIAGIPVVDHFEVNLHPLEVQLEYETGRRLFEYVFPERSNGEEISSPFMIGRAGEEDDEDDDDEEEAEMDARLKSMKKAAESPAFGNSAAGTAAGAGSLELRLQPTHRLPENKHMISRPTSKAHEKKKSLSLGINLSEYDPRKFFYPSSANKSSEFNARSSADSFPSPRRSRDRPPKRTYMMSEGDSEKRTRFALGKYRSNGEEIKNRKDRPKSDDVSQMLNRASNFMTLAYVKIPSVVLCVSYKGRGARNIEDVHQLVFTMPTLEYMNKTWSNLDLFNALKGDVFNALISHTGTILSNKFVHHRPGKQQQSRLRELASSSVVLADASFDPTPASSIRDFRTGTTATSTTDDDRSSASEPRASDARPPSSFAGTSSLAPTPESPELRPERRFSIVSAKSGKSGKSASGSTSFRPLSVSQHSGESSKRSPLVKHLSEKISKKRASAGSFTSSPAGGTDEIPPVPSLSTMHDDQNGAYVSSREHGEKRVEEVADSDGVGDDTGSPGSSAVRPPKSPDRRSTNSSTGNSIPRKKSTLRKLLHAGQGR